MAIPTSAVKSTSDITRGFKSARKSPTLATEALWRAGLSAMPASVKEPWLTSRPPLYRMTGSSEN
jgi:hypothetical protein